MHRPYHSISRRAFLLAVPATLLDAREPTLVFAAEFDIVRHGRSRRRYIHIHGNETTAREVLREHLRTAHGTAFLVRGDERNTRASGLLLDPNRMFSREGAQRSLKRLNPQASPVAIAAALDALDRQREPFLRHVLPPLGGLLFALHNNAQGYSVRDELGISDRTSIPKPDAPNEFFLCTDPPDFEVLARSPYNVVLQQNPGGEEDGSLSRLAARRRMRYVNLECFAGRKREQTGMLAWAERHLR